MRTHSVAVEVLDYKQRFVEATRNFTVVAANPSRAQELAEAKFDLDYVESVSVADAGPSDSSVESIAETAET